VWVCVCVCVCLCVFVCVVYVCVCVFVCVVYVCVHGITQWLAVPYDSPAREQSLQKLGVQGIPMLSVMGTNGQLLEQNAVQKTLSPAALDCWLAGRPA